jgi:hypothetical protein
MALCGSQKDRAAGSAGVLKPHSPFSTPPAGGPSSWRRFLRPVRCKARSRNGRLRLTESLENRQPAAFPNRSMTGKGGFGQR